MFAWFSLAMWFCTIDKNTDHKGVQKKTLLKCARNHTNQSNTVVLGHLVFIRSSIHSLIVGLCHYSA